MLGSAQNTKSSLNNTNDVTAFIDSKHAITHYFKRSATRKPIKSRFNHFVLIPVKLALLSHDQQVATLDFDSDQIVDFSANTLKMLNNANCKVFPTPLITDDPKESHETALKDLDFAQIIKLIENEKQFSPCFDVVGHGSPYGIGPLDPIQQISARQFAIKMDTLFEQHKLKAKLLDTAFHFRFHTCNSAYVDVKDTMSREEILKKVFETSYIGCFYDEMVKLGYSKISASGYRGYYCTINTNNAAAAYVQDAFFDQSLQCPATKSEYYINNKQCHSDVTPQYITFPVKMLPREAAVELLTQKTSQLKLT